MARLIAKGVNAEDFALEYAAPVRRGLEGMFFLNSNLEKLARNYAPAKAQAKVVGSPSVSTNWATLTGASNYIQTEIDETESMTLFVIFRSGLVSGGPGVMPIGNYNVGSPTGISIYSANPDRVAGTAGSGNDDASNTNNTCSVIGYPISNWGLYSVVITPTGISARNHTANLSNTAVISMPRRLAPRKLRIGSGYSSQLAGTCDIITAQIHSIAMTEEERLATVNDHRAYAARRGIQV